MSVLMFWSFTVVKKKPYPGYIYCQMQKNVLLAMFMIQMTYELVQLDIMVLHNDEWNLAYHITKCNEFWCKFKFLSL